MIKSISTVVAAMFVFGCVSSSPVNYYALNDISEHQVSPMVQKNEMVVLLQDISFPKYLQSKYIAVKSSENEFVLSDVHNWVESLDSMVTNYITERLTQSMNESTIISTTHYMKADKKISIKIIAFEKKRCF